MARLMLGWPEWGQAAGRWWAGAWDERWVKAAVAWVGLLVSAAGTIGGIDWLVGRAWQEPWPLIEPTGGLDTVAQVVPAIVVAIFVFAVGTQFVVAQVVPQARGTRAVEVLRDRHLEWTLSPALALTPMSILVLTLDPDVVWPLASALLLGAAMYLVISTWYLLGILSEATDPMAFARLLASRHEDAVGRLQSVASGTAPDGGEQKAVDDLYDVVRTLRGWARSSATAGDSRELQVALEGTLNLVRDYAGLRVVKRRTVPREYNHSATSWKTSPLRPEGGSALRPHEPEERPWLFWVPPPYPVEQNKAAFPGLSRVAGPEPDNLAVVRSALARSWVANEVGRSLVRAVEFATTTKTLLDRDRARLLVTLEKACRRFAEDGRDQRSAGVAMAYLVELGLGVRRCPPDEIDWHFEPLARLAVLHRHFSSMEHFQYLLAVGTAAGTLKVAEAITSARVSESLARQNKMNGESRLRTESIQAGVCVTDLRKVLEVGDQFVLFADRPPSKVVKDVQAAILLGEKARGLAKSAVLEPRDTTTTRPTDPDLLSLVYDILRRPTDASQRIQDEWYHRRRRARG